MKPLYGKMDDAQYIKELEARCCRAVEKIDRLSTENSELRAVYEAAKAFAESDDVAQTTPKLKALDEVIARVSTRQTQSDPVHYGKCPNSQDGHHLYVGSGAFCTYCGTRNPQNGAV